jgi:hypothetical protein
MPAPSRTHLPLKPEQSSLSGEDPSKIPHISGSIMDENDPREDEVFFDYNNVDSSRAG